MGRWKVYNGDKFPSCTSCGREAPHARYNRKNGTNAREITDYCPNCGNRMLGMDDCLSCQYANDGRWQDKGICFACREKPWVFGKKQNIGLSKDKLPF